MKEKKGISLIVLIVTIIVMIIIAGAVIISLTETNIIDQAELAVEKHNISELKSAASMAYADYLANKHSDEQKIQLNVQDYIREQLIKQGVATWEDFSKWYITPTGGIEEIDQEALTIIVELDEADSFNIQINAEDAVIDWGDNTITENAVGYIEHDYEPGIYEVKITAKNASDIYLESLGHYTIAIKSFGNTGMIGFMGHDKMNKLKYISSPNENSFKNLLYLYIDKAPITTLPDKMFKNCINLYAVGFYNCINLNYIPENLFEGCNIEDEFIEFRNCPNIQNASDFPEEWFTQGN